MKVYVCDPCGHQNHHNDALPVGWSRLVLTLRTELEVERDSRVIHLCPSCARSINALHYLGAFLSHKAKEYIRADRGIACPASLSSLRVVE